MSEKPLFQNSDEQESIYTGERVPGSGPAEAATDSEDSRSGSEDADTGLIPGAIAPTTGATTPSTGSIFAPTAGAAGLDDMLDEDTKRRDESNA